MPRPFALAPLLLSGALLVACDGGGADIVDGTITVPQDAVSALTSFAFTTELAVDAADGDFRLTFDGTFQAPDRVQGMLTFTGSSPSARALPMFYGGTQEIEATVIGDRAWWREPGGAWQPGFEPGDSLGPLVFLRQYATPYFYLDALHFESLALPVSRSEDLDGQRVYVVALDKQAVIEVMEQGTAISVYPDGESGHNPVFPGVGENAQQVLPESFSVEVWLTEDARPARIIFDYDVTEEDYSNLAFGFQDPLHLRLDMAITDPDTAAEIEPPIAIPTEAATPTIPPGATVPDLSEEDRGRIRAIALGDARLQEILSGREYEVGENVFVWSSSNLQLLGGGLLITFREPVTIEYDWPLADEGDPPYRTTEVHFRAERIEQLSVLVHLEQERLVEIQPEGEEMQITDGTPTPAP